MREELVQVGAGKGEEDERGRGPCAGMGSQGTRADCLGVVRSVLQIAD